jgi:hypothetical protein
VEDDGDVITVGIHLSDEVKGGVESLRAYGVAEVDGEAEVMVSGLTEGLDFVVLSSVGHVQIIAFYL